MLRRFCLCLLVLLLTVGWGGQALAAGTPVYLEGRQVTWAVERQGVTYLPVRAFCEILNAQVDWQEAQQRVVVSFPDGRRLSMQVGSKEAVLIDVGGARRPFELGNPPYLSRGTVQLPLRFITQEVLGFAVDYQEGAVQLSYPMADCGEYSLNLYNGEFWQGERLLGRLELPGYMAYQTYIVYGLDSVKQTEAGNILVTGYGICAGALTYSLSWYCWLNPESGSSVWDMEFGMTLDELPGMVASDGKVYFYGRNAEGLVCVDESTGEAQTLTAEHNCWWAKGDWLLTGGADGFALYNLATGQSRDITPLILTPELKEQVNELLQENNPRFYGAEDSLENGFWSCLGYMHMIGMMEDFPYLKFVGEEAGQLKFELCCRYVKQTEQAAYTEVKAFPVSVSVSKLGI